MPFALSLVPAHLRTLAVAAAAMTCAAGWAAEGMQARFSGYGTLGVTGTDTGDASFRADYTQDRGVRKDPDLGVDSRLGLQGQLFWDNGFSLTGQLLTSRRNGRDAYAGVDWLFAQYTPRPDLDLRVGRVLLNDTRNVGYTQPWLRPPHLVYSLAPFSYIDGVAVSWHPTVGDGVLTVQPAFGTMVNDIKLYKVIPFVTPVVNEMTYETKTIGGVMLQWERDAWLLRTTQMKTTLNSDNPYYATIDPTAGPRIDQKFTFSEYGVQYDNGKALVMFDYVQLRQKGSDPVVADSDIGFVTFGWRFGKVMPVFTYVEAHAQPYSTFFGVQTAGAPVINRSTSLGVRYSLMRNVALKADWLRIQGHDTNLLDVSPGFNKRHVNVISAAVDFVF